MTDTGAQAWLPLDPERGASTNSVSSQTVASPTWMPLDDLSAKPQETPYTSAPGPLARSEDEELLAANAKNIATGAIKGTTSSVTGAGLESLADYGVAGVEHLFTGKPVDQILGELQQQKAQAEQDTRRRFGFALPTSQEAAEGLQRAVFSKTGEYQPTSELGHIEQAAAAGAVGMASPGPGLPGGMAAVKAVPAGAASGAAAQGTYDVTGNPYAALAAGVIAPSALGEAAARTGIPKTLETNLMPKAVAGRTLLQSSNDPEAMKQWATEGPQPADDLVPGSKPTTFQVTGDQGIGQLERQVRTASPADFLERANQQNAARVQAMQGIEPQGRAQDLADFVTGQFRDLDNHTQAIVDEASQNAQTLASSLGPSILPEAHGEAMRTLLASSLQATKDNENALWRQVDPDQSLISNMQPIKAAGVQAYGSLPRAAQATLTPSEQTFRDLALSYPNAAPFSELQAFKSALGEALRQELSTNGRTTAYRRMSMLMDGVYGSINDAITGKIAQDNAAVVAGQMAPQDTLGATLAAQARAYSANAAATSRTSDPRVSGVGTPTAIGPSRATQSPLGQPGGNAGTQGISGQALSNFDQAAAKRLAAANAATQARVQTFNRGPVGNILAPGQTSNTYKLPESLVPQKVFVPGPAGGESIDAYRAASGNNNTQAETALRSYIGDTLASRALGRDGNLDPIKFSKWQQDYAPALSRMDPTFTQQFDDAASASNALDQATAARKSDLDAYQKSSLGRMIGAQDPQTVQRVVGGMFGAPTAPRDFRLLAREAAKDQTGAATQGMRRAILDHAESSFLKNIYSGNEQQAAINAASFQRFVRQNNPALRQALDPAQADMLNAISNDLARSNQSVVNKVPGPGTAQDILPYLKQAAEGQHKESLLWSLGKSLFGAREISEAVGHAAGAHTFGLVAGGTIGAKLLSALKASGMHKVADLVKEGVLNPDVGRALIMRASKSADRGSQHALTAALRRAVVSAQAVDRKPYASGGPVDFAPGSNPAPDDIGVSAWRPPPMPISGDPKASLVPGEGTALATANAIPYVAKDLIVDPAFNFAKTPGDVYAGRIAPDDANFADSAISGAGMLAARGIVSPSEGMGAFGGIAGARGLSMDAGARLGRAKDMGFYVGMPLYHGTNISFDAFDPALAAAKTNNPAARSAIFAAADPDTANEFVGTMSQDSSPQVMKLLHRTHKPASIALDGTETNEEIAATLQHAFGMGYDAIRMTNYTTPSGQPGRTIFAIKDPAQLRSVNAKFDPNRKFDPDLLAVRGLPLATSPNQQDSISPK